MSTKQERIAWNLTKLAKVNGVAKGTEESMLALYEIATDAKLVSVNCEQYGIDHYVFIPRDRWEEAVDDYNDGWRERCKGTALTWNQLAEWHKF